MGLIPVKVLEFFFLSISLLYLIFIFGNHSSTYCFLLLIFVNWLCPSWQLLLIIEKKLLGIDKRSLLTGADAVCLEECQKQLRSLYETSSKVKIIPWDQNSAVDIDEIYTDLSWVKDHRTPSGVTQEKLNHYSEIFGSKGPRPARKRILVYGQPGKWVNWVRIVLFNWRI